jgi:hypothetical protein
MSNTQCNDSGTSSYLSLLEQTNNSNDIDFSNTAQYVYDTSTVEIISGMCKLKALSGGEKNYPFTNAGDYSYSSSAIEVTGGYAQLKGRSGIYAQWHLNELSGVSASDSSGNGRNGTLINMEDADWQAGKLNNCLNFNEGTTNEYVDCGNIASFERTDKFSIEAWIQTSVASKIVIARHNGTVGWFIYVDSDGKLMCYLSNSYSGSNNIARKSSDTVTDNNWHHIVLTYDGTSIVAGLHIYKDGVLNDGAIVQDNLTNSIQVGTNTRIGNWGGSALCWKGKIDEVLIYNKELSAAEVSASYNSGSGTETGAISMDNPDIIPITGFSFTTNLEFFQQIATEPTNTAIKYQISANNGTNWLYWNNSTTAWMTITAGQTNTFYYNNEANSVGTINANIDSLTTSGIFLFRAFLHSSDGSNIPLLDNIYINEPVTYTTIAQSVSMSFDIKPTKNFGYISITETTTIPANTLLQYQYSINSGTSYNGSWLTKSNLETALLSLTTSGDGTDVLRIKFRLKADTNTVTPIIENLNIVSEAGYAFSGTYTSNIYSSGYNSLEWGKIYFELTMPSLTSIIIKARASNDNFNMGTFTSALSNGQETNLIGKYFQWIVEMSTASGAITPELDNLSVIYDTPLRYNESP